MSGAWWLAVGALAFAPLGAAVALVAVRRSFLGVDAEAAAVRDLRQQVAALAAEIESVQRRVDSGHRVSGG